MLIAKGISKSYEIGGRKVPILHNISVQIAPASFVAVLGASGSGKSTLISIMSGLDQPTNGKVTLDELELTAMSEDQLAQVRNRRIGFVFQSFHLIPSLTALENVMFPLEIAKDPQARSKALKLLERVHVQHRKDNFPGQLSGGEKQRVAICRALANNPAILFADEPTGNLDSKSGEEILKLLLSVRNTGTTLIIVTHDERIAKLADKIIRIADGRLVE